MAKHVVIIAGEESGDRHAATLIKQLRATDSAIRISGIGGQHMQEAGAYLVADLARYGVTGVTEVIRHLKIIRQAFRAIQAHLKTTKPDLLILVDYPGFNLRLAKYAKQQLNLRILYYISPQIWAWKAKRIQLIQSCVDQMAVIFPFEKTLYEKAQVPVHFVGHPLLEKLASAKDCLSSRKHLALPEAAPIIALLPGSRHNELRRHMPVLRDTAIQLLQKNPQLQFIIPVAQTLSLHEVNAYFKDTHLPIHFIEGQALTCMAAADFVIVASGTASLECALLKKPMCIVYKSSFLTYLLASKLIKVKFLGLCNLLMQKMIVPEFLQYDCHPEKLSHYINQFLADEQQQQQMQHQLQCLTQSLGAEKSDCSLLELVALEMSKKIP